MHAKHSDARLRVTAWCALFRMLVMATDEDGFQVVKRRGRHSAAPRASRRGTVSLEPPITTSLSAEEILARVEQYKYVLVTPKSLAITILYLIE